MEQPARRVPYGWIGFFALLAVLAFVGLSRHQETPSVAGAPVKLFAEGGSSTDRAESADVQAGIKGMISPVDVTRIVRSFVLRGDTLSVAVDGPAFSALTADDRQYVFDEMGTLWSRAYRAHHGGVLDRSLTLDFVDGAGELVHHRMLDPQ